MVDVFISYARENHDAAARLAKLLTTNGYSVWWDPAIPPGKKWAEVIGIQLGAARCIVVLWSAISVAKRWVRKEASFADARNKLIPAKLEEVTIPFEFSDVQAADLTGWQGDMNHGGFQHLLSAISEQVKKPRSENPEDDIAAATEQAMAQLAEQQAIQGQPATTDAKIEKVYFRNARKRLIADLLLSVRRSALLGKITIIFASILVLVAVSLFIVASLERVEEVGPVGAVTEPRVTEPRVTDPRVTDAPSLGGADTGTNNVGQVNQAANSETSTRGTAQETASSTTTGSIVVKADQENAIFSVHDSTGKFLTSTQVNKPVSLFPGSYRVRINNSEMEILVEGAGKSILDTGSITLIAEQPGAMFGVHDTSGGVLISAQVGKTVSLFPGRYRVRINGSETEILVKTTRNAILDTGSITVEAEQPNAIFSVHDTAGKLLTSVQVNKPVSLLPGTYKLKFHGTEREISVRAGQRAR